MLRRGAILVGAMLALLAAACSADDGAPTPTETPPATETVVASSPADLASYRFSVEVRMLPTVLDVSEAPPGMQLDQFLSISLEGEWLNPDRERAITMADLVFLQVSTETISIGDRRRLREGNRPWVEGGSSPLEAYAALGFRPSVLFANDGNRYDELARGLNEYPWEEEEIRGAPARRFTLDDAAFTELFLGPNTVLPAEINATLSADIWLDSELGTPVRMTVVGVDEAGEEVVRLHMELWDFDSGDIAIEPPA